MTEIAHSCSQSSPGSPPRLLGRDERRVVLVGEPERRLDGAAPAAAADEHRRPRLLDGLAAARARPRACSAAPRKSTRSSVHSRWTISTCSASISTRMARLGEREAERVGARAPSSPRPSRARSRPPEMWSAVAAAFASSPGARKVTGETSVPKRSVVVLAASAGDRRPRVDAADVAGLVALRDVVVGAEERLDAVLLTRVREGAPVLPGHALLALDHERHPHGPSVSV